MGPLIAIAALIASIGSLICWIITLIKMFSTDSVLKGILGLICGLYAFIWGWQHKNEVGAIMPIWTICLLAGIILRVILIANTH